MSDQNNGGLTSNEVLNLTKTYGGPIAAGVCVVGAVPVVLYAFGFTGCGIAAGTLAPKFMALSAVANGGGVASGWFVATLQCTRATGLCLGTKFAVGGTPGRIVSYVFRSRAEKDVDCINKQK